MIRKQRAGAGWRVVFLEELAAGKSIARAARAAGIDPCATYTARKRDPAFGEAWDRARETGVVTLNAGEPLLAPDEVVRASKDGRPRITRAGPGRWSAGKEEVFLAELTATSNVSAACRAAGVSNVAVYNRRARWPEFAERWRVALEQGYHRLESLLLGTATATLSGEAVGEGAEPGFAAPMTVDQAITVWRMHQAIVTGEGRRPRHDWRRREATLEEIRAEVLRRVRAMKG